MKWVIILLIYVIIGEEAGMLRGITSGEEGPADPVRLTRSLSIVHPSITCIVTTEY